jgi:hypothetical protein
MCRYNLATDDANSAIALEPNSAGGNFVRGEVYMWMGEYKKAILAVKKAIALQPSYAGRRVFRPYCHDRPFPMIGSEKNLEALLGGGDATGSSTFGDLNKLQEQLDRATTFSHWTDLSYWKDFWYRPN